MYIPGLTPSIQCNSLMEWVDGKSAAKYELCRCRREINNLTLYSILSLELQAPFGPFLLSVLRFPKIANLFQPCSDQASISPRLPAISNPALPRPPLPRDCVGCLEPLSAIRYPLSKLSRCQILALGLIERSLNFCKIVAKNTVKVHCITCFS